MKKSILEVAHIMANDLYEAGIIDAVTLRDFNSEKIEYPSRFKEEMHEMAKGLHRAGVMNAQTMKEFDEHCLPKVKEPSAEKK